MELIKNIDKETVFNLAGKVEVEPGRVNSLTLSQTPAAKITLFAIDADEVCRAMLQVVTPWSTCLRERAKSRSTVLRTRFMRERALLFLRAHRMPSAG